jgi:hypothetical protein
MSHRSRLVALVVSVLALSRPVSADERDQGLAETLFREGKRLMAAGDYAAACDKLAESERLDPAGGTLLALALCHEAAGKMATAWSEFQDALASAKRDGRADREDVAREHLAAVEPRLSKLEIRVARETAALPGLQITRDGIAVGRAAWDVAAPVDAREISVRATAPGHAPFAVTITMEGEGKVTVVSIPALAAEAEPSAPDGASSGSPARREAAVVVGVIGVVGIGLGTYFGVRAITKSEDANRVCPEQTCGVASARDDSQTAWRSANVANVSLLAGVAAVGVAIYLFATGTTNAVPAAVQARGGSASDDGAWAVRF